MKKLAILAVMLAIGIAIPAYGDMRVRGSVVSKGDSTLTLNVTGGGENRFKISPALLLLIGEKGDSVQAIVETTGNVKYVILSVSGEVTYFKRNLREDFHIVHDHRINRQLILTWADSTVQSIGDKLDWIGKKVDWEEAWITVPEKGQYYLGYIMK